MRRALRWLVRLVVGVVALTIVALIVIAVLLETSWGREQIRSHAESALAESFPGSRVDSIDGNVFGTLVLHGVSIPGADGKPVVTIGKIEVEVSMFALLARRVRIKRLAVDDVLIVPHATAPAASKKEGGGGTSWSLALENVEVRHMQLVTPAGRLELSGFEVDASVDAPAGHPLVALVRASGSFRDHPATAIVLATYDGALEVPFASGVAGEDDPARAVALDVRMSEAGVLDGAVIARVPAAAARDLGAGELPGEVAMLATARASAIDVRASVGATTARALVTADVAARSVRGVVLGDVPDVAPLTHGKLTGHAMAVAALEADVDHVRGLISARGLREGHRAVALVAVDATGTGAWTLTEAASDVGAARASIVAKLTRTGDAIDLASATIHGHAAGLASEHASADDVDARFTAKGKLWPQLELHGEGSVDGDGLATSGTTIDEAHVRLARGKVTADGALDVDIASHRVAARGMTWSGEGGHVALRGQALTLAELHTSNGAGLLTASGRYRLDTGDLAADVTARDVAIAAVAPGHVGTSSGHAKVARKAGAWDASAQVAISGFVVAPERPACDASASLELHGRRLALHASASSAAVGQVKLDGELDTPKDVTDVMAWRRLGRGALRSAKLSAVAVQLAGADPALAGTLDGELDVSAASAGGALHLRGVHTSRGDVDVDLALAPADRGAIESTLTASLTGIATATTTLDVALPAHPFDPDAWRKLGRGAILGGKLHVDDVVLAPQLLARLGVATPYRGTITLGGELAAGATSASVELAVHGLQGGALVQPIDAELTAISDEKDTRAGATVQAAGQPLLALAASLPITIDQLRTTPDLAGAPLAGKLGFPMLPDPGAPPARADAHGLLALVGRNDVQAGTLDGLVTIGGTPRAPTLHATIHAYDVAIRASVEGRAPALLHDLTIVASWDRELASFDLTAHEPAGGLLHVTAHGEPRHAATLVAKLDAATFDLAPITAFAPGPLGAARGVLDAQLTLDGFDPDRGKLSGSLHVHDARVPLHDLIGTLRNARLDVDVAGGKLTGKLGGKLGRGSVGGSATITLVGSTPSKADITLALRQISLIRAHRPVIDADVTANLENKTRWIGDVTIRKAHVVVPASGGTALLDAAAPGDLVFVDAPVKNPISLLQRPPPSHPWLVTRVTLDTTRVDVEDDEYKVASWIGGHLVVAIGGESIGIDGSIDTTRADLELFGQRDSQLDHARVVFDGSLDPVLDVRILRDLDTLVVTADVGGRASKPEVTFSSDSGSYSQGDLAAMFVGGQPGGDRNEVGQAAAAAAAGYASTLFTKKLNKLLPVHLDLELRYEAATATSSDSFDVAHPLGADTYFEYRHLLDPRPDENIDEGILEHHLNQNWSTRFSLGHSSLEWNGGGEIQRRWHW